MHNPTLTVSDIDLLECLADFLLAQGHDRCADTILYALELDGGVLPALLPWQAAELDAADSWESYTVWRAHQPGRTPVVTID